MQDGGAIERSCSWAPPPCACPNCGLIALCVDWNEVDIGVGTQTFEHEWDCNVCGVFGYSSSGLLCWRNGEPRARPVVTPPNEWAQQAGKRAGVAGRAMSIKSEEELLSEIERDFDELGIVVVPQPEPVAAATPATPATGVQLSLHTATPNGRELHEVDYVGYARVEIGSVLETNGVEMTNKEAISFPQCAGKGVTATHIALWKDGSIVMAGPLGTPTLIMTGMRVTMPTGQLSIKLAQT